VQDFRQLRVWQLGHELTLDVYRATSALPKEEKYGLTSQMRRASLSIPTNIAEGAGRNGAADFARFVDIASGSASELENLLILARDLNYLPVDAYDLLSSKAEELHRMINVFLSKLRPTKPKTNNQ